MDQTKKKRWIVTYLYLIKPFFWLYSVCAFISTFGVCFVFFEGFFVCVCAVQCCVVLAFGRFPVSSGHCETKESCSIDRTQLIESQLMVTVARLTGKETHAKKYKLKRLKQHKSKYTWTFFSFLLLFFFFTGKLFSKFFLTRVTGDILVKFLTRANLKLPWINCSAKVSFRLILLDIFPFSLSRSNCRHRWALNWSSWQVTSDKVKRK